MRSGPIFRDRAHAGKLLAERVSEAVHSPDVLVLALPRGGVPVAFEVARALAAELDVFLVRKLGLPGHEELAIGAIASGGLRVLNDSLIVELELAPQLIENITAREARELLSRESLYRQGRPPATIRGRTVILVDDGLATGASMKAAAEAVRLQLPRSIIIAAPVAAPETCDALRAIADRVVCLCTPEPLFAIGKWYQDFAQTSDEEVQHLLKQAGRTAQA